MLFHIHKKTVHTDKIQVFDHVGSFHANGSYARFIADRLKKTQQRHRLYTGEKCDVRVVPNQNVVVKVKPN